MINKIILASKSGVRKQILENHNIDFEVIASNLDEDQAKENYDEREAIYNSGEGALNFSGQTSGLTSV